MRRHIGALLLVALLVAGGGCVVASMAGCSGAQRTSTVTAIGKGVRASHEAVNRAREVFLVWHQNMERAAITGADLTSDPHGNLGKALDEIDAVTTPVLKAFTVAYAALAAAEDLIPIAEAGKADLVDLIKAAADVAHAFDVLKTALDARP